MHACYSEAVQHAHKTGQFDFDCTYCLSQGGEGNCMQPLKRLLHLRVRTSCSKGESCMQAPAMPAACTL